MATLDRLRRFLTTPQTLRFPQLSLMGGDHAPMIVEGSGEVRVESLTRNTYWLTGQPADVRYALAELQRLHADPYNALARQRLIGVDEEGVEWTLGWTEPHVELAPTGGDWVFTGSTESLLPTDANRTVAQESSTEAVFVFPADSPMRRMMPHLLAGEDDRTVARIIGAAVQFVLGVGAHGKGRRIGAADEDGSGPAQIGDHRGVLRRD